MKLMIIRHGEPDYAHDSLTPKGWREAELLADRLCRQPADAYYVSPQGRARDTARATLTRLNRQAETLDWLHEFRGKVMDPATHKERIAWDLLPEDWVNRPGLYDPRLWRQDDLFGGLNAPQICDETAAGLDALLARWGYVRDGMTYRVERGSTATLVLFCHFAIAMVMLSHLTNLSPVPLMHSFLMAPTSITTLVTEERAPGVAGFRCRALGDTAHLQTAGEPISGYGAFEEVNG